MLEMISAYLFGPPDVSAPQAAETPPASLLPSQALPDSIHLPQPPVEGTRVENLPRTEPALAPQQRIEEVAVQRVDEPEDKIDDIMHAAADELEIADVQEIPPNQEDQQRVETVGITMAGQVFQMAVWEPLMLILAMLFGGGG